MLDPLDPTTPGASTAVAVAPPAPPDPVAAVRATRAAVEQLHDASRQLRFEPGEHGMRIDVYDAEGQLVRSIPPNEALRKAMGVQTWRA